MTAQKERTRYVRHISADVYVVQRGVEPTFPLVDALDSPPPPPNMHRVNRFHNPVDYAELDRIGALRRGEPLPPPPHPLEQEQIAEARRLKHER